MPEHDGHRERLRRRFLKTGLDSFEPHEILELLLTYVIPRRDTNPIAHALLNKFGTLDKVFDATASDLMAVDGIGESAALFLRLLPEVFRQYSISHQDTENPKISLTNSIAVCKFMIPYFVGLNVEVCYLIALDNNAAPIRVENIATGTVSAVTPYFRNIVDKLLVCNASGAILCHNHPSGNAAPSKNDIGFTVDLDYLLESTDIPLLDHIIIGSHDYYSFAENHIIGPEREDIDPDKINLKPRPLPAASGKQIT